MLQPLLGTPEGIHRGCMIIKKQVFATNRDPWVTYLQVSVAKEGKVFDKKKPLQPFLYTHEGTEMGCIIFFTSSTMTVYSIVKSQSESVTVYEMFRDIKESSDFSW